MTKKAFLSFQVKTCPSNDTSFTTQTPASSVVNYNTTVTYACEEGYVFESGDTVRTCEASGALSGTPLLCSSMSTLHPDSVLFFIII